MSSQKKNRNNKPLLNPSGFTLIEVLVAITIFAIGLLAIAGMQVTGIRTNATASEITARVALAEGIMEEIVAEGSTINFSTTQNDIVWPFVIDPDNPDNNITTQTVSGAGQFSATYSITPDTPVVGVSTVEVVVESDIGHNANRTTTLTTIRRR